MGAIEELVKGGGLRYNTDKLRYDLEPTFARQEYVRVLTKGAKKYKERNWEAGMLWSIVIASAERHLAALKRGEDYDSETGCLHSAHLQCNSAFITEYYKIYPQGDDRNHPYLQGRRIGLDVDEVLAAFVRSYTDEYDLQTTPEFWNFDPNILSRLSNLSDSFWLNLKPLIDPSELTFEPVCYITARPASSEITKKWLTNNKFPSAAVFTVVDKAEKIEIAKNCKLDIFVDDSFDTFVQMNKAGVCCYLMDAPHNRRYNVGHKRIKSLSELTRY